MNIIELIVNDYLNNPDNHDKRSREEIKAEIQSNMNLWDNLYSEIAYADYIEEEANFWQELEYGM